MRNVSSAILAICALVRAVEAPACTCFQVERDGSVFVGRNYDWDFSDGLVLVNPRGLEKPVSVDPSEDRGTWVARWGSLSFNQYGRDFPTGGVNEQGLVVEVLWLEGTVFPPEDDRMAFDSVHWIQYQLDTAASVKEVIASLERVRVAGSVEVHFYIADRGGDAASVEFLDGKTVVHHEGASMPVSVLTNHTYERSRDYLETRKGWGGSEPLEQTARSLPRFARAAAGVRELETGEGTARRGSRSIGPNDVFRILAEVSQPNHTQWSIVYDLTNRRVHFRTLKSPGIRSIDLADLDFSCGKPVRMLDVDLKAKGDLARHWSGYTRRANRDLIGRAYTKTEFLRSVPKDALDGLAAYPERAVCRE